MNATPFMGYFVALMFGVPVLAWYVAVLILLYKIWQELRAIRLSR